MLCRVTSKNVGYVILDTVYYSVLVLLDVFLNHYLSYLLNQLKIKVT